jgi:hypothetical protein
MPQYPPPSTIIKIIKWPLRLVLKHCLMFFHAERLGCALWRKCVLISFFKQINSIVGHEFSDEKSKVPINGGISLFLKIQKMLIS